MVAIKSSDLPGNLRGYSCWLQYWHDRGWHEVCSLRPADARALLRWRDLHPGATWLRVLIIRTG